MFDHCCFNETGIAVGEGDFLYISGCKKQPLFVRSSWWIIELNSSQEINVSVTPKCPLVATILYSNHNHEFSVHIHLICDCDDHLERNDFEKDCPSYIGLNHYPVDHLYLS